MKINEEMMLDPKITKEKIIGALDLLDIKITVNEYGAVGLDFRHADLRDEDFYCSLFEGATFQHADFEGVDFRHSDFKYADF